MVFQPGHSKDRPTMATFGRGCLPALSRPVARCELGCPRLRITPVFIGHREDCINGVLMVRKSSQGFLGGEVHSFAVLSGKRSRSFSNRWKRPIRRSSRHDFPRFDRFSPRDTGDRSQTWIMRSQPAAASFFLSWESAKAWNSSSASAGCAQERPGLGSIELFHGRPALGEGTQFVDGEIPSSPGRPPRQPDVDHQDKQSHHATRSDSDPFFQAPDSAPRP